MSLGEAVAPDVAQDWRAYLPDDRDRALLVGRAWLRSASDPASTGPVPVLVRGEDLVRLDALAPTVSQLLELADLATMLRAGSDQPAIGSLAEIVRNTLSRNPDPSTPTLLAPCDLQPIKACGLTFDADGLVRALERLERRDPKRALRLREQLRKRLGTALGEVVPGAEDARIAKEFYVQNGLWTDALEVTFGPDAELFTKSQPMSAVGLGAPICVKRSSVLSNSEPELVLAVSSAGRMIGATLGNDVNLRDLFERSSLLLGKAKDYDGSCAIGPFIRIFDDRFTLAQLLTSTVTMAIRGADGYLLRERFSLSTMLRSPKTLIDQTIGSGRSYPDGLMLFQGSMFDPESVPGRGGDGFTHQVGDVVEIGAPFLGVLANRVQQAEQGTVRTYGLAALYATLLARARSANC